MVYSFNISILAMATFASLGLCFEAPQEQPPKADEIEKKALGHRREIVSGHLILKSKAESIVRGQKTETFRAETEIWFDGRAIRGDVILSRGGEKQTTRTVSCFGSNEHIYWTGGGKDAVNLVVQVRDRSDKVDKHLPYRVVDPRKLGFVPTQSPGLVHFGIDATLGRADRTAPAVAADTLQGDKCWKVSYEVDKGTMQVTYWYVPTKGDGIARVEIQFKSGEEVINESVSSDLTYHAESRCWFPSRCVYQRHNNGRLSGEEVVTIDVRDLKKPVDPRVFSIERLAIPPNTKVQYLDKDAEKIWDGKRLSESKPEKPQVSPTPAR